MENTQKDQQNLNQNQKGSVQNPSTGVGGEKNFGTQQPQRDTAQTNAPRSDDAKKAGGQGSTRQ